MKSYSERIRSEDLSPDQLLEILEQSNFDSELAYLILSYSGSKFERNQLILIALNVPDVTVEAQELIDALR